LKTFFGPQKKLCCVCASSKLNVGKPGSVEKLVGRVI